MQMKWPEAIDLAKHCGFSHAVMIPARRFDEYAPRPVDWRVSGVDPWELLPEAKSILVLAEPFAWYGAWPDAYAEVSAYYVYSQIAHQKMKTLAAALRERGAQVSDAQSLPIKLIGRAAGFGVIGKNSLLHNDAWGSCFAMRILITDIAPQPDIAPMPATPCGTCRRCVDACPSGALDGEGRLDVTRCIRAHMFSGNVIPEALRPMMGKRLLGCEICQRACPHNQKIPLASPEYESFSIAALLEGDKATLDVVGRIIGKNEARRERLQVQTTLAAGNAQDSHYLAALAALTSHERPAIAEHAAWAINIIQEATDHVEAGKPE